MSQINLRPWQAEAINKALNCFREDIHRIFLIDAAPGAGKTICASVLAKELLEANSIERVIVIAPRTEVVRQWSAEFKQVTGRHMSRVSGSEADIEDYGLDVCATWQSIEGLLDGFQNICKQFRTLVICDEHHHAAVEAAWGEGADNAFGLAKHVLILSGTPIRSDGMAPVWFEYNEQGNLNHPEEATYTLTYGEAVDLNYCRPITFHRHEGRFSVSLQGGDPIAVSGVGEAQLDDQLKKINGLQRALDYYRLACTPKYLSDGKSPDLNSYQATMLEWGIDKLDDIRNSMPNAGGLVIAPSIEVAEYMASILEEIDGEKPTVVHNQVKNVESRIDAFRNTNKRWIVSVAMISEGVDIKRLRILVYLPNAQTELSFRQSMGRVVRTMGSEDDTRAYVVMPTHKIFEEYARRVEAEMSPAHLKEAGKKDHKVCGICEARNPLDAESCIECETEFPKRQPKFRACPECEQLNPLSEENCQFCGADMNYQFEVTLDEALRTGAIVRGMDIDEIDVQEGERIKDQVRKRVLASGDEKLISLIRQLPEESWGKLKNILDD